MPTLTTGQMLFAYLLAAAAFAVVLIVARRYRTPKQREHETKIERAQAEALRKAVTAGTHDEGGRPLCKVCDDKKTLATERGFRVERDESVLAWARQSVGAAARYRIGRRLDDDPVYCREHAALAESTLRAYLIHFEMERLDSVRDAEVELQRFERIGLDERVRVQVEQHEKGAKREANKPPGKLLAIK